MEQSRKDMESQVEMGGRNRLVIGGEFNASVEKVSKGGECVRSMDWVDRMKLQEICLSGGRSMDWRERIGI